MHALITDDQWNSLSLVVVAAIGIVPATLAAVWSRGAKNNSVEANANAAGALHEVKANGGMSDPDPTLKDYIKFVGERVELNHSRMDKLEELLTEHLRHSKIMDQALAEVYLAVHPDLDLQDHHHLS